MGQFCTSTLGQFAASLNSEKAFEAMNSGINLLVDVGYGTLTWMVTRRVKGYRGEVTDSRRRMSWQT